MEKVKKYSILGLMSGSSLDGLDIAHCKFEYLNGITHWELLEVETYNFEEKWVTRLEHLPTSSALDFVKTDTYFGHYMGKFVNDFIKKHQLKPDFIASHGHTVFHYPNKMITSQIGSGAAIASVTKYPVICDFRTHDIALSGEGTPLAPTVDKYLFSEYQFLLNLGGIANITYQNNDKRIAYDVSPCNQILNSLSQILGFSFDDKGEIARNGKLDRILESFLNEYPFFQKPYPKSLDNTDIKNVMLPKILNYDAPIVDKLHTCTKVFGEHIAKNIASLNDQSNAKILVSGGGAYNLFLLECINNNLPNSINIEVPENKVIEYKEALLMALLGLLRVENQVNCFSEITNATSDSIGGAIYQGFQNNII